MGIYIYLDISKSVSHEQWSKVYKESLRLAEQLPFAELQRTEIQGINTLCITPTKEHEALHRYSKNDTSRGWIASGNYIDMTLAEDHVLYEKLVDKNEVRPDAGDAIMNRLPSFIDCDPEASEFNQVYNLWGSKTQGESYHIYLLGIACLIEARLGNKAFVYGDITRGQCRKAVKIINKYLEEPIDMPDSCYMERLADRISALPISEPEQISVFVGLYKGTKKADFGEFLKNYYSENSLNAYWKTRFDETNLWTIGFDDCFRDYLLWGFNLETLCTLIPFEKGETDCYEKFVRKIMESRLYIKNKNCKNVLEINPEDERTYGIYTLMMQILFAGAGNEHIDRYIPLEEIRASLIRGIGNKCDINKIVDEYVTEEQLTSSGTKLQKMSEEIKNPSKHESLSEIFEKIVETEKEKLQKNDYTIQKFYDLLFYETNDTVSPEITETLKFFIDSIQCFLQEDNYQKLIQDSAFLRKTWLVEQNKYYLIRDKDWEKIFTDIEENENAFARYYPIIRMQYPDSDLLNMGTALLLNDDVYEYAKNL